MSNEKGKITLRQAFLLFLVLFCAPAIRYIPIFTTQQAKEAAWLTPFIALILEIIYFFAIIGFRNRYPTLSFIDMIKDILGKFLGSVVCLLYFFWMTIMIIYNSKMFIQRISATAMPNVNSILILVAMLLLVIYILKNGIIPLAKMTEIFFILLSIIFFVYNILILPQVDVKNLYPITYKDTIPVLTGSLGIIAIFAYNILLLMINDKIDDRGEFKKQGFKTLFILFIISLLVIVIPLSVFGWSNLIKMPIPYLNTMMQISLFHVIERIEAGIVMFWIVTDFVMIAAFTYAIIHMIRIFFKLQNAKPLLNIYVLLVFFLILGLSQSSFELKILSEKVLTPINIAMGYCIPIIIFLIGKVRKKV